MGSSMMNALFGGLASGTGKLPILGDLTTIGMPDADSAMAEVVDSHYAFINIVNVIFFVPIVILLVYFAWRYRKPPGEKAESDVSHNTPLEITWTVIPMILVVIMFTIGFRAYNEMHAAPADAYTIHVNAQQWSWSFAYPEGFTSDYDPGAFDNPDNPTKRVVVDPTAGLHLPPGVPIRMMMTSSDVLHSFFIPEFRVKMDVVPGKISSLWFEPYVPEGPEAKQYWLLCTEYCGTSHSEMQSTVWVHPTWESFNAWKKKATSYDDSKTWEEWGEILYRRKGCAQCHSIEAAAPGSWTGPTWDGLWGKTAAEHQVHIGGATGPTEGIALTGEPGEEYLLESIRQPNAKIVVGYNAAMPLKKLTDEEILYLIAYIKTLGKEEE